MSDTPEWSQILLRIADGLEIRKRLHGGAELPGPHTDLFIGQLREIAAMDLGPLERSGVCETCESEAVKRAETAERKLELCIRLRAIERGARP